MKNEVKINNISCYEDNLPDEEGYYMFFKKKSGFMSEDYMCIAHVGYNSSGQLVVNVPGQSSHYSESVLRYQVGWLISSKIA